ncbi:MAG TPA: hypothetical protein ENN39_00200 [Desulfonatronum sp.]|nr:hypothetical protein [Desulfonatronum sp.]
MIHMMRTGMPLTLVALFCALILAACGTDSNDATALSKQGTAKTQAASAPSAEAVEIIVPSGWKTVTSDNWTFSVPDDWVESSRTYHPKGAVNSMGVAHTFCLTGVIAIEETGVSDDNLTYMVGFGPLTKTPKTVCGKDGFMVEGKEGLSLFYEYEPRPGYGPEFAIDAIYCTAQSSSTFRQYEAVFRHVIDSAACSAN